VPPKILKSWIRKTGKKGARALAQCLRPDVDGPTEVIRFLLREFQDDVGGIIAGNLTSGVVWVNIESGFLQERAATLRRWVDDADPAIAAWATSVIESLEARARSAAAQEEEE
jgi:hypothetical protein